jgi:hypothetical protein
MVAAVHASPRERLQRGPSANPREDDVTDNGLPAKGLPILLVLLALASLGIGGFSLASPSARGDGKIGKGQLCPPKKSEPPPKKCTTTTTLGPTTTLATTTTFPQTTTTLATTTTFPQTTTTLEPTTTTFLPTTSTGP